MTQHMRIKVVHDTSTTTCWTNHLPYNQPDTLAASTVTAVDNARPRRIEILLNIMMKTLEEVAAICYNAIGCGNEDNSFSLEEL